MKMKIPYDQAESIALQALTFLARDPARLGKFLAETGFGPQDLKNQLKDQNFLGGVLDYLINQPELMAAFLSDSTVTAPDILLARLRFPGANKDSWLGN